MRIKKQHLISTCIFTLSSTLLLNCSALTSNGTGSGSSSLSSFATTLSEDMVLTSPTAQRTGASIFSLPLVYSSGDILIMSAPDADDSPKEKKEALETLLAAEAPATCNISINLLNAARASCYGPNVNYLEHEFDGVVSGSWPGGDLGIWEDTESSTGEACVAAQLTAQMKGAISYVDAAQFIAAGMACVANKNGETLPSTAGVSLDLTTAVSSSVTVNSVSMTVSSAIIARDTDDGSGNPVYVTTLTGTLGTKTIEMRIKHIPTSTDDSTNKGKISVSLSDSGGMPSTDGISLEYIKASSTSGKLLMKKINFNGAGENPFVSGTNYSVDYTKPWDNNADYFLAEINPTKYTGTFAYAWQAGASDSHTRVFNAVLNESGGVVSGTSFYGYGPTMQAGAGSISGMICAWTGPDQNHTPAGKVQQQDLYLSSGKFIASGTNNVTYDPVADCDADTLAGAPFTTMTMTWGVSSTRSVSNTVENLSLGSAVSSTITLPTAPTQID